MAKRLLELEPTDLFGEKAILTSLSGREELSKPYEFMLNISSPKDNIRPEDVIGQPLAVRIDRGPNPPRFVHGYISHLWAGDFSMSENKASLPSRSYRVRLVPWLWFLTRAARCFIYLPEKEKKSIKEVFDEVIKRVKSYGHVETWHDDTGASILKSRKVEHCVQYRETDFNFLSRTLERYGIFYYFKHEAKQHTMILSDKADYPDAIEKEIRYAVSRGGQENEDIITSWEHAYEFVSGKWSHIDYDFKKPSTSLSVNAPMHGSIPLKVNSGYELYDNPNDYVDKGDGKTEAERRMEEEEFRFNSVAASSHCKTLAPGFCFRLTQHHSCPSEQGKSFLVTSINHSASQPGPFNSQSAPAVYVNHFLCIPKETQYRPPRATPHPVLSSVQTAMVVGPPGEEIHTDEFGRVKVQFHWDRVGIRDDNTSCWIRVSQIHAGTSFGGIDIPRVGEEVIVSFIEGDLDRPLITGRVYNKEAMPPFGLPGEKTRSGIKTKTYKGSGYNELTMDDTPGKEQIRIHGQHDLDTVIEHNETHKIKNNRTKNVGVNEGMSIGSNQTLTVGNNRSVTVGKDHTETIGRKQTIMIGKDKFEIVGNLSMETIGFAKLISTASLYGLISAALKNEAVGSTSFEEVGGPKISVIGDDRSATIAGNEKVSAKKEIKIDAGKKISIVCGQSKIEMDSGGKIMIQGTDVTMQAGAGKVNIDPGGIITIKGPMVRINT